MQHLPIQELARWLQASDIDTLELSSPQGHVRLQRGQPVQKVVAPAPVPSADPASTDAVAVRAPGLGVFLHSHPQRNAPLVQAGQTVAVGQVIGLLQIGPLLLPVPAPCQGVVDTVALPHGDTVGYGTPLFTLRTQGR